MVAGPGALLQAALAAEREGRFADARRGYDEVVAHATQAADRPVLAEALRRQAVLAHQAGDSAGARGLLQRSHAVAVLLGDDALAAQALNALGGVEIETGALGAAEIALAEAASLAAAHPEVLAKVAQNQGVLANIRGDFAAAAAHYEQSLAAYEALGDAQGRARAHHNLGMLHADHRRWAEADLHFDFALVLAREAGDVHLEMLCLVNRAAVQLELGATARARELASTAERLVATMGGRFDAPDLQLVLARCDRAEGNLAGSLERLQMARAFAERVDAPLTAAEATLELGRLCRDVGRTADARRYLAEAVAAFESLGARADAEAARAELATLPEPSRPAATFGNATER